jgi:hypothetical protein
MRLFPPMGSPLRRSVAQSARRSARENHRLRLQLVVAKLHDLRLQGMDLGLDGPPALDRAVVAGVKYRRQKLAQNKEKMLCLPV